jgi:sugar O-acyltransferase (sialic acid O-acetyltransferase NeuD family)
LEKSQRKIKCLEKRFLSKAGAENGMEKIIVYGASYPDIFNLIDDINDESPTWDIVGVVDDVTKNRDFMGYPVLGGVAALDDICYQECAVVNNVYSRPAARESVAQLIKKAGKRIPSLIHPSVSVRRADVGNGVVIMQGAQVGAQSIVGDLVAVRSNAVINHDNVLESLVFVGPGATLCGHVHVGQGAYIGAASVVRERLTIGAGSFVGMGAVVTQDVTSGDTVAGNPAQPIS